ncbi:hypothetical protein ACRXCV_02190 [Halobacteriovorax sp. GFR7]|uniref:hypothetical protein n=1 Tax=unclassified Halobacteriovorax TaxID=2639665 RepID=UPI003D963EB3
MENKKVYILLGHKGQSTVEYILLFVVVTSFAMLVFKSEGFQNMVGEGMFGTLARSMEYSARYGDKGSVDTYGKTYGNPVHPLYYNNDEGRSHFFSPVGVYDEAP